MAKVNIIYWSGTGNTEAMANAILEGAKEKADAALIEVESASEDDVLSADTVFLGCPAMGDEVLEEYEFEPFMESIDSKISGKNIVLFGSYSWAEGKWMEDWEERVKNDNANLLESYICFEAPDDDKVEELKELGRKHS